MGRTKQQNGTKCNKTNKTQQNNKIFVVAQQNNKIFCSYTTKQQKILFLHNKTTKYFVSPKQNNKYFVVSHRNILLFVNIIFCWFIDYPYQHRAQIHLAKIDIL